MRSSNSASSIVSKILRNIVLILFLVIFVSIVYNFRNRESPTESALMTHASDSVEFKGVFIRDEEAVIYNGTEVLSYSVPDGGRLGDGSVIAETYNNDSQIVANREISKLEKELDILNKIQNPGTLESAQPASLSENIERTYRNLIYSRDIGDYDSIQSEMEDLLVKLSTYQIVTDEIVDFGPKINDINARLTALRSESVAPTSTITSDQSAYFVSYCDGYEEALTKEGIDSLTIDQLNNVSDSKQSSPEIVGKLIYGYEWYLAGVVDNSKREYAIGDKVMLRFETTSETFAAEVIDVRDEGDPEKSIIVVSCMQFNYDLVQHRTANVELIKEEHTGLKVPREAIRFSSIEETIVDEETGIESTVVTNYKGVNILEGEQVEFRKIDVIYEGSDYVLSDVKDDDKSYLALYDNILVEGDE